MSSISSSLWLAVLNRDNAYDALFANSTPRDIHCISSTCRDARRAALDYNSRAYDINGHLHRFVADPDAFRRMQYETNCIISGSYALQFMDRTLYPESDMDLYVTKNEAVKVANWIVEEAGRGYRFVARENQPIDFEDAWNASQNPPEQVAVFLGNDQNVVDEDLGVDLDEQVYPGHGSGVFSFIAKGKKKIQVIACNHSPMEAILSFHSTVVMNAITYSAAISLFPEATFEARRNAICSVDPNVPRNQSALAKYAQRGWTNERYIDDSEDASPRAPFIFGKRWIGDKHTWAMPLGMKHVNSVLDAQDAVGLDRFTLNGFSFVRSAVTVPNNNGAYGNDVQVAQDADLVLPTTYIRIPIVAIQRTLIEERELSQGYTVPPECSYKWLVMFAWTKDWTRMKSIAEGSYFPSATFASRSGHSNIKVDYILRIVKEHSQDDCTCTYGDWVHRRFSRPGRKPCPAYCRMLKALQKWMDRPLAISSAASARLSSRPFSQFGPQTVVKEKLPQEFPTSAMDD